MVTRGSNKLYQRRESPSGLYDNGRASSNLKRALIRSLELAKEAVRLDSTNADPHTAMQYYSESVALLNEIMERMMPNANGIAAQTELMRLRSIVSTKTDCFFGGLLFTSILQHNTYVNRMNILRQIHIGGASSDVPTLQPFHLKPRL